MFPNAFQCFKCLNVLRWTWIWDNNCLLKKLDLDAHKKGIFFVFLFYKLGSLMNVWYEMVLSRLEMEVLIMEKPKPIAIVFSFFTLSLRPFLRMNILKRCWWMPLFHFISLEFPPQCRPISPLPPSFHFFFHLNRKNKW